MRAFRGNGGWFAIVRWVLLASLGALALVACGGGGSNGASATPDLQGTWRVSAAESGTTVQGGSVPGADVPTQQEVSGITTASVAQLLASTTYQGYTVVLSGGTLTITGTGTNLVIVINNVSTSNYKSCGLSCGVGAVVSFDLTVGVTLNGTSNGQPVSGTATDTLTISYTRAT
jgi:hypothetical protein